ncbi:MAG: 50S ribosomal protein L9 [Patescibacteria group bacterium]
MKVILQKDVPKIGKKYDVKEVSSGYSLNFLIPKGLAKAATPEALKKVEELRKVMAADMKVQEDLLSKNLHEIEGKEVEIKAKASDKGHLFASIHAEGISEAIKKSIGADIPASFIMLEKPIKETGSHNIEISASGKKATLKLVVAAE